MAGGKRPPLDGAKELAAGRHYPAGAKAWKASLARCKDADEESKSGPKLCKCGCNRPAFGRFDTCCTHCTGPEGPHAQDCLGKGYPKCEKGCGRLQFGRFTTCCTHCKGPDGPHARDCLEKMDRIAATDAPESHRGRRPQAAANSAVVNNVIAEGMCARGCGRPSFKSYETCCKHCQGPSGPHAGDCEQKAATAGQKCAHAAAVVEVDALTAISNSAQGIIPSKGSLPNPVGGGDYRQAIGVSDNGAARRARPPSQGVGMPTPRRGSGGSGAPGSKQVADKSQLARVGMMALGTPDVPAPGRSPQVRPSSRGHSK